GRGNPVKEEGDSKGQRMTLSQSSSASIGKARQQKKTLGLEKHSEQAHESVRIHKFQLTGTKKALPLRQINIMLSLSCPDCDGEGHRPSLSLGPTVHLAGLGTLAAYAPAWQEVPTQFDMELLVHLSAMKVSGSRQRGRQDMAVGGGGPLLLAVVPHVLHMPGILFT
ncbi:hypothetical protein NEUTE2DRAFT_48846, partial [Neurospora tetrasperma FGSC 2509]